MPGILTRTEAWEWQDKAVYAHLKTALPGLQSGDAESECYSRWPVGTAAMPAWLAAKAPIIGNWNVLPW